MGYTLKQTNNQEIGKFQESFMKRGRVSHMQWPTLITIVEYYSKINK